MNPRSPVCRTCLGIISEGNAGYNIDDENGLIKNVRNIREMIMFCVPEMDVFISVNPSICETCLAILINVYNFKIRCMRVENAIRSYILANNIMEGSCVNLSNVVKQQILEVLKQKNWPPDVIREYIVKVDKCLKIPEKNIQVPLPSDTFNTLPLNFNSSGPCAVTGPVSQNLILPFQNTALTPLNEQHPVLNRESASTTPILPNNQPENNQILNDLLNGSLTVPTHVSPPPSYEQALKENPPQSAPSAKKYLSVAKNLMPERREPFYPSKQLTGVNYPNTNPIAPNMPQYNSPAVESFQNTFLSTLNLISTSNGGREEAVLVRPQEGRKSGSRFSLKHNTGATKRSASAVEKPSSRKEIVSQGNAKKPSGLRAIRKFLSAKDKNKEDDIIILDDDDSEPISGTTHQTLVMNFDEAENVLNEAISRNSVEPDRRCSAVKMFVNLPMISRETLKRKLSSEDVIEEILSNHKRLRVNINPSLPYLHKNKRLVVKVKNDSFLKCTFCCFATFEEETLKNHYDIYHRICKLCAQKFDRKMVLDQHISIHHSTELKNVLKLCEEEKSNFDCHLCKFVGLCCLDLRDHRIRIHIKCDEVGMYRCPFPSCDMEDAIAYSVAKHAEWKHDNPRRRECQFCNYIAKSAAALKIHVHSHSLTKISCPVCGITCKTSVGLERHIEKKHADASNQGLVYTSRSDHMGTLTTDTDGRITLNLPGSSMRESIPVVTQDMEAPCIFDGPSLSELLCVETFNPIPDQEDDCTIINQAAQKKKDGSIVRQKSVILNKRNRKSTNKIIPDDSEDCVIISESVMTIDLSRGETHPQNSTQRQKNSDNNDGTSRDIIEIVDDECYAFNGDSSRDVPIDNINLRPTNDSEMDTCSELSTVPKQIPPLVESNTVMETRNMLDEQKNNSSDIELGKQEATINNSEKEPQDKANDNVPQSGNVNTPVSCTELIISEKGKELDQAAEKYASETLVEMAPTVSQQNLNTDSQGNSCLAALDNTYLNNKTSEQLKFGSDDFKSLSSPLEKPLIKNADSLIHTEENVESRIIACSKSVVINSSDEDNLQCSITSESSLQQKLQNSRADFGDRNEGLKSGVNEAISNSNEIGINETSSNAGIEDNNKLGQIPDVVISSASKPVQSKECQENHQGIKEDAKSGETDIEKTSFDIGGSEGGELQPRSADPITIINQNKSESENSKIVEENLAGALLNKPTESEKTVDTNMEVIENNICHDVDPLFNEDKVISLDSELQQPEDCPGSSEDTALNISSIKSSMECESIGQETQSDEVDIKRLEDNMSSTSNIESFMERESIAGAKEASTSGERELQRIVADSDIINLRNCESENSIVEQSLEAVIKEYKEDKIISHDIVLDFHEELKDDTTELNPSIIIKSRSKNFELAEESVAEELNNQSTYRSTQEADILKRNLNLESEIIESSEVSHKSVSEIAVDLKEANSCVAVDDDSDINKLASLENKHKNSESEAIYVPNATSDLELKVTENCERRDISESGIADNGEQGKKAVTIESHSDTNEHASSLGNINYLAKP